MSDKHIKEIRPGEDYEFVMSQINLLKYGVKQLIKRGWYIEDAKDMAMDALIRCAEGYKKSRGPLKMYYIWRLMDIAFYQKRKIKFRRKFISNRRLIMEDGEEFLEGVELEESLPPSDNQETIDFCDQAMECLSEREILIIKNRFWDDLNLGIIAEKYQITGERVRQIIEKAMSKMREASEHL